MFMKKIAMHVMLIALTLFLIACNPEAENKVTTFCAPPTVYRYFVKKGMNNYDLSSLKHISLIEYPNTSSALSNISF